MGQRQHAGDVQKKAKVFEADPFKVFIDRLTRLPPIANPGDKCEDPVAINVVGTAPRASKQATDE
jgi:hypothetical protein